MNLNLPNLQRYLTSIYNFYLTVQLPLQTSRRHIKGKNATVLYPKHYLSSPELKAQVSFSDRLSSVVCLSVCPSVCKLFLFWTSSQEPLGQF